MLASAHCTERAQTRTRGPNLLVHCFLRESKLLREHLGAAVGRASAHAIAQPPHSKTRPSSCSLPSPHLPRSSGCLGLQTSGAASPASAVSEVSPCLLYTSPSPRDRG
eukprot:2641002-Rhodomonas_salina.1